MRRIAALLGIEGQADLKVLIWQFIKFGIVGLSNTLISLAIYYFLVHFGMHYVWANTIGFIISVLNAFFWNSRYVFKSEKATRNRQLIKTFVVYGVTFALSTLLLYLMVDRLKISELVAPLINLCITIPLNFFLNRNWTYKQRTEGFDKV